MPAAEEGVVPQDARADRDPMRRTNDPPAYTIISERDAVRLTGRDADELRELPQVQTLTRVLADGKKAAALRVPTELLANG
jgi:hypothetical protein